MSTGGLLTLAGKLRLSRGCVLAASVLDVAADDALFPVLAVSVLDDAALHI